MLSRPIRSQAFDLRMPDRNGWVGLVAAVAAYGLLPFAFFDSVEQAGGGSVQLIRTEDRTGQHIDLDRARYRRGPGGDTVELYSGHFIRFEGLAPDVPSRGKMSVQGTFTAHDVIHAGKIRLNYSGYREFASILGLAIVFGYWLIVITERIRRRSAF